MENLGDRIPGLKTAAEAKQAIPESQALSKEILELVGLPAKQRGKLPELTEAFRKCSARQRIVLRAFADNEFVTKRTIEMMGLLYDWATPKFVRAALSQPPVKEARKLLEQVAAESIGISAASIVSRTNSIVEDAIVNGDRQNALRGLNMLAEVTGVKPQGGASVNVGVQVMVPVEQRYDALDKVPGIKILEGELA